MKRLSKNFKTFKHVWLVCMAYIKRIDHDHALYRNLMQKQTPNKKVIFAPTTHKIYVHLPRGIIQLNRNVWKWLDRFTLWRGSRFIWWVTWRRDIKEVRFALVFGLFCLRGFVDHERSRSFSLEGKSQWKLVWILTIASFLLISYFPWDGVLLPIS